MIFYAHRGNTKGPNPSEENNPAYLKQAIDQGFHVEVDLWFQDKHFWFGHDGPDYRVKYSWMTKNVHSCIFHCKNIAALAKLRESDFGGFHFFWHQNDDYTMTNEGFVWVYPGRPFPKNYRYIACEPDLDVFPGDGYDVQGICSDYVYNLRKQEEEL